jgi:flagellar FliL protein
MAKELADGAPGTKSGLGGVVIALLALTALAGSAGFLLGGQAVEILEAAQHQRGAAQAAPKSRLIEDVTIKPLSPVLSNLSDPKGPWVRIEASLVVEGQAAPELNVLARKVEEDILAFLKTVSLAQIEGASGFQHLREDLNERARIRGGGKVRELIIQSLILE